MRLFASQKGMSLSQESLKTGVLRDPKNRQSKVAEGTVLPTPTEESVFEALGLPFRQPNERDA